VVGANTSKVKYGGKPVRFFGLMSKTETDCDVEICPKNKFYRGHKDLGSIHKVHTYMVEGAPSDKQ
jgi:hypothetical protein